MTRVALMPSSFWPAVGGVEEAVRNLAKGLTEAGDEVEVWAPLGTGSPAARHETWQGLALRRFPMPLPPAQLAATARAVLPALQGLSGLARAVRAFRPDVINVHCFGPNGAYALAVASLMRVPLVTTLHGETAMDDNDIFDTSVALRTALRLALKRSRAVTACSAFTVADAARFGLRPSRATVIFNGVDLDEHLYAPTGSSPPFPAPFERYALALGRAVPKKGFDLLLRALADPAFPEDLGLVIGGDGNELERLRDLARELCVAQRVHFPGRLSRAEVQSAIRGAEIFVVPSRLEPFGIVILEAWREAKPVVATVHGGVPEFARAGSDALLVDPFQPCALAAAVRSLYQDPAARARLGDNGRRRLEEFSWPQVVTRYRQVYARAARPDPVA